MKFYPFALLALAACSSGSTIEVSAGGVGGSGEGGADAGVELADAADEKAPTCGGSAAGEPCAVDSDCKPASACERPRCDETTLLCIVTDGLPDGDACEEGGACASRRCCQ